MTQIKERVSANTLAYLADDVLRIASGRILSVLLEMSLDLELFAKLQGKSVSAEDLGEVWEMPLASARIVAQALTNVGLLKYDEGAVTLAPQSEKLLVNNPAMRRELAKLFKFDLDAEQMKDRLLNPPVQVWYQIRDEGEIVDDQSLLKQSTEKYIQNWRHGLHQERLFWGKELAQQYDFSRHEVLLDLGGSTGGWCMGVRKVYPDLRCIVFDIADAIEAANELIAQAGEQDMIEAIPGSVFTDELPPGIDCVLMANFLGVWAREDVDFILGKTFSTLQPGGAVLIKEPFLEDDWTGNVVALFYGFILSGADGKGAWRASYGEMEELLRGNGFVDVERGRDLLIARKPTS